MIKNSLSTYLQVVISSCLRLQQSTNPNLNAHTIYTLIILFTRRIKGYSKFIEIYNIYILLRAK